MKNASHLKYERCKATEFQAVDTWAQDLYPCLGFGRDNVNFLE